MKDKLFYLTAVGLAILLIPFIMAAAASVRLASSLDGVNAVFNVTQQSNGANLSVDIPAITISTVTLNSTEYKKVDLPAADHLFTAEAAEEGKPDVPIMTTLLAIPAQAGVSLSVSYSGYDTIEDIDLAPAQPSPSDSDSQALVPFTRDENTYSQDAFYPPELAISDDPVIMRDVRGVQIELHPVQYNPVRRQLRVYRDLSVSVSYDGEVVNPKTSSRPYLSDGFYPLYQSLFSNFQDVYGTMEVKRGGYVIICKPTLVDSLKVLALWKHKKGYYVRIVPTTEINSNGSPTYSQIYNYLRTAYQTWEDPPEYVMLVGDISGTFGVADYPYSGFASDHHYACVDGTDYLPDIFIARLSVDNMQEFRRALAKIFKYEEKPLMRDPQHWIRGLGVGYTYYESSRLITLWVRHLMLENGFAHVDTIYGQSQDPHLMTYFNNGPGFIFYRGAGATDGWDGPSFNISDLNAMQTTNKLGVLSPLTCGTGDFSGDCFGETWIKMGISPDSLKGGPAFYGVSDHNTHTQWNNPIMVGYFFGIFGQNAYHFAAAAVMGKLQDYRTFPRHLNNEVQQYFNTYNMLGDPELELRTKIPIMLSVSCPETIAFGLNQVDIGVNDTAGNAIKDAFVTLLKLSSDSSEELYSLGKTDESGNVSLSFNAQNSGSMYLTVSGQNLYPFEDTLEIVRGGLAVGVSSFTIDDDTLGYSYGNGDSLASPGETLELGAIVNNFGDSLTAYNVVATLTPLDNDGSVEVLDGVRQLGDLGHRENRSIVPPYVVHISPNVADGATVRLEETITDQDSHIWHSTLEIPIKASQFAITYLSNHLNSGDTANLVIGLVNRGELGATVVVGTITTEDDYSTIRQAVSNFGDMPIGDTVSNGANPMVVGVDAGTFAGRKVNFTLNLTTSTGVKEAIPFSVKVDSLVHTTDPTGPDTYGYYAYDKNDTTYAPHPTYSWVELAPGLGGQGTRLNFGSDNDDKSVLISLPFDFVYYGATYRSLIVCTNGFVSPDTSRIDQQGNYWAYFFNWPIPDPGNARAQISPFWDDLVVSTSGNNGVFTWNDTTAHRYVIEWNHTTNRNTSAVETFEMVIYDPAYNPSLTGDADILYQYSAISNNDAQYNYSTVGIESWDELTGVEYSFDNQTIPGSTPLANNLAVLFTTNTGRGGVRGNVVLEGASDFSGVKVSSSTGQQRVTSSAGDFWLRNVEPGVVSLTAQALGYFPAFLDSVVVTANSSTLRQTLNLSRCLIPQGVVASDTLEGQIRVTWEAVVNQYLVGYDLYRSRFEGNGYQKLNEAPLTGLSYSDNALRDTSLYWYKLSAVYSDNGLPAESFLSGGDSGRMRNAVGISENSLLPGKYFLSQNYPNPFNPTTIISYGLPQSSEVKVEVFNLLGQRVVTLLNGHQDAGYKSLIWNGKDNFGKDVSSGVYLYKIEAGRFHDSKKMIMLK